MHVPLTEVILRHDGAELARATLAPGEYVIGREPGVDLCADTPLLSRKHARLTINYDHLLLEGLASSNGTFVNDRPIAEPTRLFPNQSIRLGPDITLEVRRQRAPTEPGVSLAPAQAAIARHLPAELLGEKRYAIGGVVAQGGMGAILDARQNATKRTVAMKVMLATGDEAAVLRFIEEAQVTAQLDHPNIVPIYELGVDEQGQVFYTMKMVRGITLKKVLADLATGDAEAVEKYPLPALLTVFQKVCDALAFAHAKGVIHRDLKPENIMLGDFGSVLVMDWGLAKVLGTQASSLSGERASSLHRSAVISARAAEPEVSATMAGSIMGTPAYMSPEQARGEIETLDARSDIYALGSILFEIVHLRPAVTGTAAMEIVGKVARGEVEWNAKKSARVPDSLLAICRQALALDPTSRYCSIEALQTDLLAYQNGFATSAEKAGAWKQAVLFVKRHKAVSIATAILLVVISAALANVIASERRQRATLARLRGTAPTFVAQAGTLIDDGKFDDALGKLAFATELAPGLARAHLLRGHLLQTQLHFPAALASLQTALSLARDPAEVADARANLALCEKIQAENRGLSEVLPKSLAELTEAISRQGRTAEALSLAPRAGLAEKFRYEAMFTKLKALLKIPDAESGKFRKNLRFDDGDSDLFTLDLSNFPLSGLSPLQGLPIRTLYLRNCSNVSDLSPLSGMPLDTIEIPSTKVSDLSSLRGMKLKRLSAFDTKITDLVPLAGMPLTFLDVHSTGVSDLTPLVRMPLKELDLVWCREVSDLHPLKGIPLERLNVTGTKVSDISVLKGMPLRDLQISGTNVRDVSILAECTTLEKLLIPSDAINVDALRHLPNLNRIGYSHLQVMSSANFWADHDAKSDPQMRERIAQVRAAVPDGEVHMTAAWGLKLELAGKDISDLRPLRPLPIDFLSLTKSKVTDLAPLRGMRLKMLTFDDTAVADVSPLLDLPNLEAAMVTQRATNLEVLRHHPTLKFLGWENDWDADANRPKLTTAEFWIRYDAQKKAGAK